MATVQIMGPADHGRPMSFDEFMAGDYEEGYHYELIDGKLYVTPMPNLPENRVEMWLIMKLHNYSQLHPAVANYVSPKAARVRRRPPARRTCPEPDVAVYRDFPLHLPFARYAGRTSAPSW